MRLFVTGASGWIGAPLVKELLQAGHSVTGLARNADSAQRLEKLGAQAHIGSLQDLDSMRRGAAAADGVVHLAFIHEFTDFSVWQRVSILVRGLLSRNLMGTFAGALALTDRQAIDALGEGLVQSSSQQKDKPFVIVTGTMGLTPGRVGKEQDRSDPAAPGGARSAHEEVALAYASRGLRPCIVRLPPTVHGCGDAGLVPRIIDSSRKAGVVPMIGDGSNRWAAVHRLDAAHLLRLVVEKGKSGARYHGVAEEGVATKDLVAVIAKRLRLPSAQQTETEATKHLEWVAMFWGVDNPANSEWTQRELGWTPTQPTVLDDLDHEYYFEGPRQIKNPKADITRS